MGRHGGKGRHPIITGITALMAVLSGCGPDAAPEIPTAEQVEAYYTIPAGARVRVEGEVAEIRVVQEGDQLTRGGELWAKVGPYIYLFTEATREVFTDFDGLEGVRVVTLTAEGTEVARATLFRDALNGITWRRALNVTGNARKHGTDRPGLLSELVRYGEDHTEFEYNPTFTAGR